MVSPLLPFSPSFLVWQLPVRVWKRTNSTGYRKNISWWDVLAFCSSFVIFVYLSVCLLFLSPVLVPPFLLLVLTPRDFLPYNLLLREVPNTGERPLFGETIYLEKHAGDRCLTATGEPMSGRGSRDIHLLSSFGKGLEKVRAIRRVCP